jgi:hypothetical protein
MVEGNKEMLNKEKSLRIARFWDSNNIFMWQKPESLASFNGDEWGAGIWECDTPKVYPF